MLTGLDRATVQASAGRVDQRALQLTLGVIIVGGMEETLFEQSDRWVGFAGLCLIGIPLSSRKQHRAVLVSVMQHREIARKVPCSRRAAGSIPAGVGRVSSGEYSAADETLLLCRVLKR